MAPPGAAYCPMIFKGWAPGEAVSLLTQAACPALRQWLVRPGNLLVGEMSSGAAKLRKKGGHRFSQSANRQGALPHATVAHAAHRAVTISLRSKADGRVGRVRTSGTPVWIRETGQKPRLLTRILERRSPEAYTQPPTWISQFRSRTADTNQ